MAVTYEPIATTTLGTAGTVTFSSIAASWTDLRIVVVGANSTVTPSLVSFRFNGDSASNYSYSILNGNGASATSSRQTSVSEICSGAYSTTALTVGVTTIDVFGYAGSTYKTALVSGSYDNNGAGQTTRVVGLWRSTSAITSILVGGGQTPGNLNSGTTVTLYGIKAA